MIRSFLKKQVDRLIQKYPKLWLFCNHGGGMQIVDYTDDGNFVIHCKLCGTGWIASCVVEGFGFKMTKSALSRGCKACRASVFNQIKNDSGAGHVSYKCPECNETWDFKPTPVRR